MDVISVTLEVSKFDKSKDVSPQLENIYDMFVTFDVLKFERTNFVSPHASVNIPLIVWTFEVSKVDKSKLVNEEQFANIMFIRVTFEVSKLETSKFVRFSQSENMSDILVTLDVSRKETSKEVPLNPPNIQSIFSAFVVLKPDKFKFVKPQTRKIPSKFFTLDVSKFDTSKFLILLQPKNISDIFSTSEVSSNGKLTISLRPRNLDRTLV